MLNIALSDSDILNYYHSNKHYKGQHSIHNQIPKLNKGDFIFLNSDDYNLKGHYGEHWYGLYCMGKYLWFIDSFGASPPVEIVLQVNKEVRYQTEDLQAFNTNSCGYFVIYFFDHLIKGMKFENILKRFTLDPSKKNRAILKDYFKK